MLRLFRTLSVIGCAIGAIGMIASATETTIALYQLGKPRFWQGPAGYAKEMFDAMGMGLIILMTSSLLYVGCEIARRLGPPPESD